MPCHEMTEVKYPSGVAEKITGHFMECMGSDGGGGVLAAQSVS